jgi:hypothetical protein
MCVAAIDVFAVDFSFIFGGFFYRWTRSNWAFLNFPPEMLLKDSRDRYTPQFDVAAKASNLHQMYSNPSSFSTTL